MLQTKELTIGYSTKGTQTKIIQQQLSLCLQPKKLTALLGMNGIGKSTLIRTLSGQLKPLSGSLSLREKELSHYPPTALAKEISVVLTAQIPTSNLKVKELLQISRTPHITWQTNLTREDQYWIDKAIALTSIADFIDLPISNLSDGQMQRVLLARALAQNTPILLLDEPSSHLDLHHKVKLYQLLHDLTSTENKTILFSSHDIELALQFAMEGIVLQQGHYTQNTIGNLISNGVFDRFFPDDVLKFDRQNKRFILAQ